MGSSYSQLNAHKRRMLDLMLSQKQTKVFIARCLGVHISTIYREIKRNRHYFSDLKIYRYQSWRAQRNYIARRARIKKIDKHRGLKSFIQRHLKNRWSPHQIEWFLKHKQNKLPTITHESIYRYLYTDNDFRCEYHQYLRRKRRFQKVRNRLRKRRMNQFHISLRPEKANSRDEFGHWECDLMMFQKNEKRNLITLVERKSRYTLAIKNENKQSRNTALNIIKSMTHIKPFIASITFDQGSEFSDFEIIRKCLEADVYFCTRGAPYEKGSIENRNGVIRTVLPRNYDMEELTQEKLNQIVSDINERPMSCINFNSPEEEFHRLSAMKE